MGKNLPHCHFVVHKSHMLCPVVETVTELIEVGVELSDIWSGHPI
jgi:hypothetical protein